MHFTFCIYWKKAQAPCHRKNILSHRDQVFLSWCNFQTFVDTVEDTEMILSDQEEKLLRDPTLTIHQTISLGCKTWSLTMQAMFKTLFDDADLLLT